MAVHAVHPAGADRGPAPRSVLRITQIVGQCGDAPLAARLHELEHQGRIERVHLSRTDMARRRQAVRSDRGTDIALLLDRDAELRSGSVLWLDEQRAIVVALDEPELLVLRPAGVARALELGYFAGNMHWKVRFEADRLCIVLEGPRADYLQRLSGVMRAGDVVVEGAPPPDTPTQAALHGHPHQHDGSHAHSHAHAGGHGH